MSNIRTVQCRDGQFVFNMVYVNGLPKVDVYFEDKHIGMIGYYDLDNASDIELIQAVDEYLEEME